MDLIHGMLKHMASYVFSTTVILLITLLYQVNINKRSNFHQGKGQILVITNKMRDYGCRQKKIIVREDQ